MNIDLAKLNDKLYIDEDFTIDLNEYHSKEIKGLNNLHVKGYILYNTIDNLELDLILTGEMILKDSVTLEDINYPLNIKINEYSQNKQNILDIIKILWENIVLEVPIRLTTSQNVQMAGEGWSIGEEHKNDDIDPRLAKLASLLEEREE